MANKKFQIDGVSYEVNPHPPTELGTFALKLASLASGPLAVLFTARDNMTVDEAKEEAGEIDLSELDPAQIQSSLYEVVKHISEEEIRDLFSYTTRSGKHLSTLVNYENAYKGNWGEWYKALWNILKANGFFDFLSSLTENSGSEGATE